MNMDLIKKQIQSFFDRGTVTIVGSGLSCSEGIPGMSHLASALCDILPKLLYDDDLKQWHKIAHLLMTGQDLESALLSSKLGSSIENAVVKETYKIILDADDRVFKETATKDRDLRFSEYLSKFNLNLYNVVVITTNYDLLIEYACEALGVPYNDSFSGKIVAGFSPEKAKREMLREVERGKRFFNTYHNHVVLYKPHGSINWKMINGKYYRIRHHDCGEPCIITPGLNKFEKGYFPPFDYHIGKMGDEIDRALKLVFIGYGFNDNHLETHLKSAKNSSKPTLIVTKTLSQSAKNYLKCNPNAIGIEFYQDDDQTGSQILWGNQTRRFENIRLWDMRDLIREVLE